jgi:hypothetical protein
MILAAAQNGHRSHPIPHSGIFAAPGDRNVLQRTDAERWNLLLHRKRQGETIPGQSGKSTKIDRSLRAAIF